MPRILRIALAVAAIFALTAIGVSGVYVALLVREARVIVAEGSRKANDLALQSEGIARHLDATVTDLDRMVLIAGGAINQARQIERDNRKEIQQINQQMVNSLRNFNALLVSLDASQKSAAVSIQQTSAALVPVMQASERDLRELQPAIQQATPLLQRSTDIAVNLSNATADVQHEIHKFVYPPPRKWWQKWITDPLRDLKEMFKFTHPIG